MDPTAEPATDRPRRVVIEHPSSLVRLELTEELRAAGYDVTACSGPRAALPRACPLLADERCPLLDAADVIVNGLHAEQATVLAQQRRMMPDTPVLLLAGADTATGAAGSTEPVVSASELLSGADVVIVLDDLVHAP
jgi:hypothetical protein